MTNKENLPILAVRAIILNRNNRILLLKRASNDAYGNLWCLPGGKIDFGFTAKETIIKEVREEISLECSSADFLFYQDSLPQNPGEKHYLTLYFQCQARGDIKLNEESSDFGWIGLEEIGKYKIAFKNDEAIRRFTSDQNLINKHR